MEATRTRIKICGITRPQDARHAAEQGADAIGLVFHAPSSRHVDIDTARAIAAAVPAFVTVTGLFVNAAPDFVDEVLAHVPLNLLQFHGDESAGYCAGFGRPYMKALRVRPDSDLTAALAAYPGAAAILLDAWHKDQAGGTGQRFDWHRVPRQRTRPLVLAGGLDAGNVAEAIATVRPCAVDVSSGVEEAPGIKCGDKVKQFIKAVNSARG